MRQIAAIALITFRESLRSRGLVVPLAFGVVVLATTPFTPAFSPVDRIRVMLSVITASITLLVGVVAIFTSTSTIAREITDNRVLTVFSRPVGRLKYVIGKAAGIYLVIASLLLALGAFSFVLVHVTSRATLTASETSSVLAGNTPVSCDNVEYYQRTERQIKYRSDLQEYERILTTARKLYDAEMIPGEWRLQSIRDAFAMSDDQIRAAYPGISPAKLKIVLEDVLTQLTGHRLGGSPSAWNDFFTKNPSWGHRPADPDENVDIPAAVEGRHLRWDFRGLSRESLKTGLAGNLQFSLYPNIGTRKADYANMEIVLSSAKGSASIAFTGRADGIKEFRFTSGLPDPDMPFSLTLLVHEGPSSAISGKAALGVYPAPSLFVLNLAKSLLMSWCIAAFLATVGIFGACFLSFPVALLLCLFVYFWGGTVGIMRDIIAPSSENPLFNVEVVDSHRGRDMITQVSDFIQHSAGWVNEALSKGIEDFGTYDGGRYIPDSRDIPLSHALAAFFSLFLWRAIILLALGWLFLRRREF
ncbi:MAG: hypothetical protein WC712_02705 [Candidatus Brocadiia bacterium]